MPSLPPVLSFTGRTGPDSSLITPMSLTSLASINTAVAAKKRRKSHIWVEKMFTYFTDIDKDLSFAFLLRVLP